MQMSSKVDEHMIQELKRKLKEKKPDEPVEKFLRYSANALELL